MPISYKHKIYTALGTPTDLSGNVVSATDSAGVPAKDYTIKGKAIVWNQLFTNSVTSSNGVTISNNQDGTITLNGTASNIYIGFTNLSDAMNQVHKYLLCLKILNNPDNVSLRYGWLNRSGVRTDPILTGESCVIYNQTASQTQLPRGNGLTGFETGTVFNNVKVAVMVMDLTQMFGAGNEPATPEEFRAMFPDDYYPYNAGELKTIVPTSIEASGVNLLDLVGRKEISGNRVPTDAYPEIDTHVYYRGIAPNGYLNPGTVVEATISSSSVVVKTGTIAGSGGYGVGIPLTVIPSTTYYIRCTTPGVISIGYVNSNKIITASIWTLSNNQFTTPRDCRYILIIFRPNAPDTVATFENICVSAVQTNEYQPYNKYRVNIPSSKYFPDGMRSAGSAYDEINFLSQKAIKRIGAVDMGTLNWSYTNASQFFYTSLSGAYPFKSNVIPNIICSAYEPRIYGSVATISASDGGININGQDFQPIPRLSVKDRRYSSAADFKAAMSGVMLYYELATPVETEITPPLQALPTYKGFTSFSAPNSLTQNGPLSVTYYAEGGTSPEKGWLTSYKRKLYMGRTIEWNQLFGRTNRASMTNNGVTAELQDDGSYVVNGTATDTVILQLETSNFLTVTGHKYFVAGCPKNGSMQTFRMYDAWSGQYTDFGDGVIFVANVGKTTSNSIAVTSGYTCTNLIYKPQLFDLTQMFGAGNEPATPEEFWSYFDHKLYPYNTGETQPLFKISRKSQWGSATPASLYVGENIIIPQIVRN